MHLFPHRRSLRIAKTLSDVKRVFHRNVENSQKSLCSPTNSFFCRFRRLRRCAHGVRERVRVAQKRLRTGQKHRARARERNGVPVARDAHGDYYGVDAVIDKDFASACLAEAVGADYLFILTAVDHVCLNFGTPEQRALDVLHADDAERYLREGQFGAGSMQPKVAAAVQFVRSGWRRRAVIASLAQAPAAMRGESGTRIVP